MKKSSTQTFHKKKVTCDTPRTVKNVNRVGFGERGLQQHRRRRRSVAGTAVGTVMIVQRQVIVVALVMAV